MRTVDEVVMRAPARECFDAAADVERWPERLPHYRWVTFQRRDSFGTGRVEMAARRNFGVLSYPVWWVSEMHLDSARPAILYTHVEGVTTGMAVEWTFEPLRGGTRVRIVHRWRDGPAWPLPSGARRALADQVIGPVFIHHVASRTLDGIRAHVEGNSSHFAGIDDAWTDDPQSHASPGE